MKKTKVGTLTFHIAHNYGAMLQAYALEKAINSMGVHCEVIDYRFPYIDQWSGIRTFWEWIQRDGFLKGIWRWFLFLKKGVYRNQSPMGKKFNAFMRKELNLSARKYFYAQQLKEAGYDVVVIGSDQVWNPKLTDGALDYFGGYFNEKRVRLVSYAASCGKAEIESDQKEEIGNLLNRFSHITVREKGFEEYLKREYALAVDTVMDPVFLLSQKQWDFLTEKVLLPISEPYILLYAFDTDDTIYRLARRIANEQKLKIITIVYEKDDVFSDMIQLDECGPKEFVTLIKNATYVCTTSFHGQAFALLFEKNFYCVAHPAYGQRNIDLLSSIGMSNRLVAPGETVTTITDCDYSYSSLKIKELKDRSFKILNNMICG